MSALHVVCKIAVISASVISVSFVCGLVLALLDCYFGFYEEEDEKERYERL